MSYEPNPSPGELAATSKDVRTEPKFASLTADLLARKGEAEPALEPFAHARIAATARQMAPGERHALAKRDDAERHALAKTEEFERHALAKSDDAERHAPAKAETPAPYEDNDRPEADESWLQTGGAAESVAPAQAGPLARFRRKEPAAETPFAVREDAPFALGGEPIGAARSQTRPDDAPRLRAGKRAIPPPQGPLAAPAPAEFRDEPAPRDDARESDSEQRFAENCPRERITTSRKRAAVTFRMSVHDFLRLKLAAAELEISSQDIIIDAVAAYLDDKGVERLDNCRCLKAAGDACEG